MWAPPDYANAASFEERAVTIKTERWELPGFVTLPKTADKHPAVVLVHGSGPNDMDESNGPNKMFKDITYRPGEPRCRGASIREAHAYVRRAELR